MTDMKTGTLRYGKEPYGGLQTTALPDIKHCRDCGGPVLDPVRVLCDSCRALAEARRRERRRVLERERSARKREAIRNIKKNAKEANVSEPRRCVTEGCTSTVEGRARYCDKCRRLRLMRSQREYRRRDGRYVDFLMSADPPTSLAWLDRFKDWSSSGMSYGEYQAAERTAAEKRKIAAEEKRQQAETRKSRSKSSVARFETISAITKEGAV